MIKLFNHYLHRRTVQQVVLDFLLVLAAVLAELLWRRADWSVIVPVLAYTAVLAIGMLVINAAMGFYQRVHNRTLSQSRARAVLAVLLAVPVTYALFGLVPLGIEGRKSLALAAMLGLVLVLVHRVYVAHSAPQSALRHRVLVFGTGQRAALVGRTLKKDDPHVDVVGYYASPNEPETEVSAWGILSRNKSLTDTALELEVDEIVVALVERRGGSMPLRELLDCKLHGVRVVDMATHFEKTKGQIRLDSVSAGWLVFGDGFSQGSVRNVIKRIFDIVCALVLILLTAPIMLMTALAIKLESRGPVFYRQERVGFNGRLFNVVKFRSMRTDAEKDGPQFASAKDNRVTRIGRFIRKVRIDELPQLFSVLKGDMSLVGPRPERPFFVDQLTRQIPYYAVRQSVKPGVTGWAQVRYPYGASLEDSAEKLQYDLYYVKNHSLFLDLVILFETVGVVVMAKGAR
ncbi:TIGR03013 family XrtA/PEP-CTERM system glycosyltransferase [Pseudorhodoferax sp.]|uniref:TIGR03013 family XrtA/PEP-CTERM system glycosyltransferase n=1 Tax=Pseudorhodoferax sp. TaxID=1993553 RepID=UPI0039E3EF63